MVLENGELEFYSDMVSDNFYGQSSHRWCLIICQNTGYGIYACVRAIAPIIA